jgi:bacillithiol biosynthesis cysteine-adding enzyme BshC
VRWWRKPTSSELARLLHPTALYRDFLSRSGQAVRFYPSDFRDPVGIIRRASSRPYPAERRAALHSLLARQAERFGTHGDSGESLGAFARDDALVVVAGQQPGLFGGPLYTVYKGLTAVAFARSLAEASGRPVVPIFWIASDDHDFEEVRRTWLNDHGPEPVPLEYPAEAAPAGVSVARIRIDAAIEPLLEQVASALPPSEFREPLMERLRDAYAPGRGYAEAFARFAGGILAGAGALVLDPSDPEAKRLALPVFEREISLLGGSARAAHDVGEALVEAGYHAQIARGGDELNLFWHGAHREAIRITPDRRLRLHESGRTLTPEECLGLVRERPEDASPGVLLRPIMQDFLLPTAAYVGGPAETAYWAQVSAVYPLFDLPPTPIVPRAGATLLEPRIEKILKRFEIGWEELAADVEHTVGIALRRLLPEDFPGLFARERTGWVESFGRLGEAVSAFDPSLRSAVETATGRVLHEGEVLEKKLMQVWKRRHEEWVAQIRRAAGQLFPRGGLQERTLSILGYEARYGPALLDRLKKAPHEPGAHPLVPIGVDPGR